MHMSVIWGISVVLALLPLLMAVFFLLVTLPRKTLAVKQDLHKLRSSIAPESISHADNRTAMPDAIDELVEKFYDKYTLSIPALLLTLFYAGWIELGDAFLNLKFNQGSTWFFPGGLVDHAGPMLYAFVGVYLFNLGNLIRRLYLGDLNEQVFWGAINRLWLSLGLGLVVQAEFPPSTTNGPSQPAIFFSIGFLANIFLEWVLDKILKLLNVAQPRMKDLPLQMVNGINIWKEYRLEEEGIENVQNLATADVTELAVRTHYNFRTLIDWIDQSLLLVRLTSEQSKTLTAQATAISAIEMAAASPKATGSTAVANSLATVLKIDPILMGATMDRLYEDQYVQDLWNLWQSGKEGGTLPPSPPPPPPKADGAGAGTAPPAKPEGSAAAAAAAAGAGSNVVIAGNGSNASRTPSGPDTPSGADAPDKEG